MSHASAKLGLVIPDGTDPADIGVIAAALEGLDNAIGATVVDVKGDVVAPYNGQIVREDDTDEYWIYDGSQWRKILVANTSGKFLVDGSEFTSISDNGGGFQVGPSASANMQVSASKIQARDANVEEALKLNPFGGAVQIGDSGDFAMYEDGFDVIPMLFKEAHSNANVDLTGSGWIVGADAANVTCLAPHSGRVKVTVLSGFHTASADDNGYLGYQVNKNFGDNAVLPGYGPGADDADNSRVAKVSGNGFSQAVIADIVIGLTPGNSYRFRSAIKRDAGDDVTSIWRRIMVEPTF
jgi:hypothetical protein